MSEFILSKEKDLMDVVDELRAEFIKTHGALLDSDEAIRVIEEIRDELRKAGKI